MNTLRVIPVDAAGGERRRQRMWAAAWVAGAALLMLSITVQPLRDSDVWWHLALGRLIVAHGIPAHEPFSFLTAANQWVGQQWLYEVLLAGLVGAGGAGLASIVMGAVAVIALVVAAGAVPRSLRVPGPWLAVAILLSGFVMGQLVGVRGQVLSLLGTAIVLYTLARWREGRWHAVWVLPPLFLVWANLHAGFIVGLVIVALALLVARPLEPGVRLARGQLGLALAAGVAATLVNPAGPGLYGYVFETFTNPTLTQLVTEWSSPDFHSVWLQLFEVEAVLLVVLWAAGGGPDRLDAVLAFAALAASLQAQRNVSLFALIALPQVATYSTRAWRLRVAPRLRGRSLRPLRRGGVTAAAMLAVIAVAVGVTVAPRVTPAAAAAFESSRYPDAAATYVAAHDPGQRLYSSDVWGGYLAYRFPQGRVVFLYDETAIFGNIDLQWYLDVHLLRDDWTAVLTAESIHHAIVGDDSPEASAFHEIGWTVDCYDSASGAMVMSSPPPNASPVTAALTVPPAAPAC